MEGRRVVERLGGANKCEVGARRGHVVDNLEHEIHPAFVQSVAKLFRAIGGAKMVVQRI